MESTFEAGTYHVQALHAKFGKDRHFLQKGDVNYKNFDAVIHIIDAANLLDKIAGATADKCYVC